MVQQLSASALLPANPQLAYAADILLHGVAAPALSGLLLVAALGGVARRARKVCGEGPAGVLAAACARPHRRGHAACA